MRCLPTSYANVVVRAATLGLRFAILFFVVRHISLEQAGVFGIGQALISASPAVLGFSINYHLPRIIQGVGQQNQRSLIWTRISISALTGGFLSILSLLFIQVASPSYAISWFLISLLCAIELTAYDLTIYFISNKKSTLANLMNFFRSAAWVPVIWFMFFAGISIELPQILIVWIAASLSTLVCFLYGAGILTSARRYRHGRNLKKLTEPVAAAPYVYANELANALYLGLDKYVVGVVVTLGAAGAYTFYGTFAAAAYTLVYAATIEVNIPDIVHNGKHLSRSSYQLYARSIQLKSLYWMLPIGLATASISILAAILTGSTSVKEMFFLSVIFLIFQTITVFSTITNTLLFGIGEDRFITASNVAALLISIPMYTAAGMRFGAFGVGAAIIAVAAALAIAKHVRLVKQKTGRH